MYIGGNDNYAVSVSIDGIILNKEQNSSRKHIPIVIAGEQLFYTQIKVISIKDTLSTDTKIKPHW